MGTEKLSERLRATLEHLKQAKELGSTLSEYAAAFNLDVKELYNGRTQLQHKGLWPKVRKSSPRQPQLLAVEVSAQNGSAVPTPMNEWMLRLITPGGWVMECREIPEVSWLRALSATPGEASS